MYIAPPGNASTIANSLQPSSRNYFIAQNEPPPMREHRDINEIGHSSPIDLHVMVCVHMTLCLGLMGPLTI